MSRMSAVGSFCGDLPRRRSRDPVGSPIFPAERAAPLESGRQAPAVRPVGRPIAHEAKARGVGAGLVDDESSGRS